MSRSWQIARTFGLGVLVVLAALESALEVALRADPATAPRTSHWFAVPAVALIVLSLLACRRFPFAAPVAMLTSGAALSFVDGRLVVFPVGVLVASAVVIVSNDPHRTAGEFISIPVLLAAGWFAGRALGERAARAHEAEVRAGRAERERETAARIGVAEERARIARELHDIVAHSVSVMVLQAGAVRHKLPASLAQETEALKDVEATGRTALAEMRRLLGAMREERDGPEMAPQPGLGNLDALFAQVRRAGLPVEMHVEGDPLPLPAAIDLSAYRIVQEGLTNALKHAGASRAEVDVRYGAGEVRIEVRDDGHGPAGGDGLGHGLVGIGERVKLYGGEMAAGRANGGGFVLSTRLPIQGGAR